MITKEVLHVEPRKGYSYTLEFDRMEKVVVYKAGRTEVAIPHLQALELASLIAQYAGEWEE